MKRSNTPVPDLTASIDIDSLSFLENDERDFVVDLFEVLNVDALSSVQLISFMVTRLSAFDITVPGLTLTATDQAGATGSSNVGGGRANQNGNWLFKQNSGFIAVTAANAKVTIPAGGSGSVGFHIKRKAGIPVNTSQNITVTIVSGSGGETNAANNTAVTTVTTT